jgi:pentose-5-phosphate-3-epimerase
VFVAGSAVFGADDPDRMIGALRDQAQRATATSWWCGPA